MNKQTLYIITGLPYSGKTTLTNELVKRFHFTVASVDEVLEKGNYVVELMTQQDWDCVYSKAYTRLKRCLGGGKTTIFDGGSLKRSERETIRRIAESMNVTAKLIYVNTSKDEIRRRWLKNQKTKVRDHLGEKSMNFAFKLFEEPSSNENPILYYQKMDLGRWIEDNIIG